MARLRGTSWMADVMLPDGRRLRKTFKSKAEAEAFEKSPIPPDAAISTHIGDVFNQAYRMRWARSKNAKDVRCIIDQIIDKCGYNNPCNMLTKAWINKMVHDWLAEGNSEKRINRKLSVLRPCIAYAIEQGAYTLPMPKITNFKEKEGRLRYLTPDEAETLTCNLESDMSCIVDLLLYTGCRVGELFRVKWDDITEDSITFWETKSGKPRTVPLTRPAKQALFFLRSWHPDTEGPCSWTTYDAFHKQFTEGKRLARLGDDVVPHTLRHTCASWMVQRGVSIVVVSKWLGHSDISVTMRYAHLAPKDLQMAAQVLEAAFTEADRHTRANVPSTSATVSV